MYGFDRTGRLLATVHLRGAAAVDWEDMCRFHREGKDYLAIADVGDNQAKRSVVVVYVIEEPDIDCRPGEAHPVTRSVAVVRELRIRYPTGACDCESLAYDPRRDAFLLASKERFRCRLWTVPAADRDDGSEVVEARLLTTLALPLVTAADISPDGSRLVLGTYGPACILQRRGDAPWSSNGGDLQIIALPPRRQGEAICFNRAATGLLLTTEGSPAWVWEVDVPPQEGR
ncbi:MAG: hypothetical protein D6753_08590 [Planctomycetota bacterium]|nr:MAG: hypothetical protein D6753_08590 [Planctomycetota bacterium]